MHIRSFYNFTGHGDSNCPGPGDDASEAEILLEHDPCRTFSGALEDACRTLDIPYSEELKDECFKEWVTEPQDQIDGAFDRR